MLARDSAGSIVATSLIGLAVLGSAFVTHLAIGQTMSPEGAAILFAVVATPGVLLIVYSLFLVWFFRDPERPIAPGVVSPADGRVLFVETIEDPDVGTGHRVAIFMSPLDVHVNRAPARARLDDAVHIAGGFLPAFQKESERNERLTTRWTTLEDRPDGAPAGLALKVVQIAGTVARRIAPWSQAGDRLGRGERFGMIRLGSRVDVYLPAALRPVVRAGDRVRAGSTTLAEPTG